jgi:hypothetical protein
MPLMTSTEQPNETKTPNPIKESAVVSTVTKRTLPQSDDSAPALKKHRTEIVLSVKGNWGKYICQTTMTENSNCIMIIMNRLYGTKLDE